MSIRADIDRGLEILAEMEKLETELKNIEVRVKHAALHGVQVELKDADRGGRQYLAAGSQRVVPVIFTDDKLMSAFAMNSDRHQDIMDALPHDDRQEKLLEFFKPIRKYENRFDNGKKFRIRADELLGNAAPAFITACLARDKDGSPKSDIKIMWQETQPAKP